MTPNNRPFGRPAPAPRLSQPVADAPVGRVFFWFCLLLVFIRFSEIHQFLTLKLGLNLYLLYLAGIPTLIGVIVCGGVQHSFRYRPAKCWAGFVVCVVFAAFFSAWRGGSVEIIKVYLRTDLVMLFVIAGLTRTWKDCRLMLLSIAAGALFTVVSVRFTGVVDANDRTSMSFGTVSNSNDYAGQLILVLPIVIWVVMSCKNIIVRLGALGVIALGVYQILASGSRGAAVAIAVDVLFLLVFGANMAQRIKLLVAIPVILLAAIAVLPARAWQRILSLSSDSSSSTEEARESSAIRRQLLQDSILTTFQHPLLGVGPGQFSTMEGRKSVDLGLNLYYETHNSYTQITSECGIPAFLFWLAGLITPLVLITKAGRNVPASPEGKDLANAVLCIRLSMVGFCTVITFLNFGYFFYQPAMAGLAIAVFHASRQMQQPGADAAALAPALRFGPGRNPRPGALAGRGPNPGGMLPSNRRPALS